MADLPVVLVFASHPVNLKSHAGSGHETNDLDCRHYSSDENLNRILAREQPDVVASFGNKNDYPSLNSAPREVQQRWLHFETDAESRAELEHAGAIVFTFFMHRVLNSEEVGFGLREPLVSVFTPTYRPGARVFRAFRSLQNQTYTNWEWVLVDDSDDDGVTLQLLKTIAIEDQRVTIHSMHRHSGRIGELKRRACALAKGKILVELDHDDELTPNALALIVEAFQANPDAAFVYSDFAEIAENSGAPLSYGGEWAFGYGHYRLEEYGGRELIVAETPPINAHTIRHIVGVPNHVRSWKTDDYWQIGGHNPKLHVADDYELIVRTFLRSPMVHIPKLCYVQYLNSGTNAQDSRRPEIQRLTRCIQEHYDRAIHERLVQLGLPDPFWGQPVGQVTS